MKTHVVYFSATYTTRAICEQIANAWTFETQVYDVTNDDSLQEVQIPSEDVLVMGIPVYAGRIPTMAVERLQRFKGQHTKAIAVAVYGNRDYDDALLELTDMLHDNGFQVIGAGAFIARHCIFPQVATHRPDAEDKVVIDRFATRCHTLLMQDTSHLPTIQVKGNRPYREPGKAALRPTSDEACNACGKCARLCPTGAISLANPPQTDNEKCIACGRCIVVCPTQSRNFRGEIYEGAAQKFNAAFGARREAEVFYVV